MKIKVKQAIIVEGKYDKIKLDSIVDGIIITTDGFGIFKDEEKKGLIRKFAQNEGVVILTDSDSAGFLIRSHINGFINNGKIINVYIPDIFGKEKRKTTASKEGKIGVEGIKSEVLINAFKQAGIIFEANESNLTDNVYVIKKSDLYEVGFIGCENSLEKRKMLLLELGLPERLSTNNLIKIIPKICTKDKFEQIVSKINSKFI